MSALAAASVILLGIAVAVALRGRSASVVYPPHVGLLYRNGRFVRELAPGRHVHLPFVRTRVVPVSLAELPVTVGELTVLSRDQFSFRVTLGPVVRVVDARVFAESQPLADPARPEYLVPPSLHPMLQPAVAASALAAAARRPLVELLDERAAFLDEVATALADAVPGARITQVLLTGITLPPETRKMFTEVERARFEAQAGLERARGEQAALRLLANSARMMTDSPGLGTLRLLQAIETAKGSTTVILGAGAEGLALGTGADARR